MGKINPILSKAVAQYDHGGRLATQSSGINGYSSSVSNSNLFSNRLVTIDDIVIKTATGLGLTTILAVISYILVDNNPNLAVPLLFVGSLGALGIAWGAIFTRKIDNPFLVLTYAALEGVVVGSISFVIAAHTSIGQGVILQTLLAVLAVVVGMLVVYRLNVIRVTPRFNRILSGVLFGALFLILINIIVSFFHPGGLGLRDSGFIGIIFSLIMIVIGAFSLLSDFDYADQLVRVGAPAKAAWGAAFGLIVTIIWIYIEVLRLISNLNSD